MAKDRASEIAASQHGRDLRGAEWRRMRKIDRNWVRHLWAFWGKHKLEGRRHGIDLIERERRQLRMRNG